MKIQVKPIGYKFRVTNDDGVFDIESTTELSMTKSDEIIRKFFDNFIIRKSDKGVGSEEVAIIARPAVKNEEKRNIRPGANHTMNNIMRSNSRMVRQTGVRPTEKPARKMRMATEKDAARFIEKKSVRTAENKAVRTEEKKPVRSTVGLTENIRESVKNKWQKLGRSLNDEFTLQEYIKSLRDAGYKYSKFSWEAVPSQQISRLVELGEIEKIGRKKPFMYRKIKVSTNAKSEKQREILKI
jgi:hypothetical protein